MCSDQAPNTIFLRFSLYTYPAYAVAHLATDQVQSTAASQADVSQAPSLAGSLEEHTGSYAVQHSGAPLGAPDSGSGVVPGLAFPADGFPTSSSVESAVSGGGKAFSPAFPPVAWVEQPLPSSNQPPAFVGDGGGSVNSVESGAATSLPPLPTSGSLRQQGFASNGAAEVGGHNSSPVAAAASSSSAYKSFSELKREEAAARAAAAAAAHKHPQRRRRGGESDSRPKSGSGSPPFFTLREQQAQAQTGGRPKSATLREMQLAVARDELLAQSAAASASRPTSAKQPLAEQQSFGDRQRLAREAKERRLAMKPEGKYAAYVPPAPLEPTGPVMTREQRAEAARLRSLAKAEQAAYADGESARAPTRARTRDSHRPF